mgnify:CR=1 FL=1
MAAETHWHKRWQDENTPWNLERPHPLIEELWDKAQLWLELSAAGSAWVPGCGHGYDADWWQQKGFAVTATDLVPEAITAAKKTHPQSAVNWQVDDALSTKLAPASFDLIYDRAMMLALPLELRRQFLATANQLLRPGGVFLSLAFTKVAMTDQEGPPFAMAAPALVALMPEGWNFVFGEERDDGAVGGAIEREMLGIWQKEP